MRPYAEVDDMAMLRLMARDSGGVTLVPEVVVQDELKTRLRQQYRAVPRVFENFYAITMRRHSQSAVMQALRVGFELAPGCCGTVASRFNRCWG